MDNLKELEKEDIEKSNFEYLIDNFIVKTEITMIAAKQASEKTLMAVSIVSKILLKRKVDKVLYFDLDNSTTTLKQLNIHLLKDTHGDRFSYIHSSKVSKKEVFGYIKHFQNMDLTNKLFVFDSAKNFMMNTGNRDKDVTRLLDEFKKLRDKGATVIFLHNANKDLSLWLEDGINAYMLDKHEHRNRFVFKKLKSRVGELKDFAFRYNQDHILTTLNLNLTKPTKQNKGKKMINNFDTKKIATVALALAIGNSLVTISTEVSKRFSSEKAKLEKAIEEHEQNELIDEHLVANGLYKHRNRDENGKIIKSKKIIRDKKTEKEEPLHKEIERLKSDIRELEEVSLYQLEIMCKKQILEQNHCKTLDPDIVTFTPFSDFYRSLRGVRNQLIDDSNTKRD
jgi:hypothetical protein